MRYVQDSFVARLHFVGSVTALLACDAPTGTGALPGLTIRADGGWVDTIVAPPVRVLLEVRDSVRHPIRGAIVQLLYGVPRTPGVFHVGLPGAQQPSWPVIDTTDAAGRGEARLWHGGSAGEAWLRVDVLSTTVPRTTIYRGSGAVLTTPGQPAKLIITPQDTALHQGNSGTFTVVVADRFGNPRPEQAELEPGTAGISVAGMTVTAAAAPSRQVVRARFGSLVDSAWLSIVPRGTIAVRIMRLTEPDYSYVFPMFQLDGSQYTRFLPRGAFGNSEKFMGPQWARTGHELFFFEQGRLFRTTTSGSASPLFPAPISQYDMWQQTTPDESWIYFNGATPAAYRTYVYRARIDGSEASRIPPGPERFYENDLYPSPSPDGQHVVYSTDRETGDIFDLRLQIVEVETGVIRSLGVAGKGPRWSPTGEWIAFGRAHHVYVVRPDGTGLRQLSAYGYEPWVSWSPDGRWLAAERYGPFIDLIQVETGLT